MSLALPIAVLVTSILAGLARLSHSPPRRLESPAPSDIAPVSEHVGRVARRLVGRSSDTILDRQLGRALMVSVAVSVVSLEAGIVSLLALRAASVVRRRKAALRRADRISAGLADVIDLLAVALVSGKTVADAIKQVIEWDTGDYAEAFQWCERQVADGRTLGDALELVPTRLGPVVQPLVSALVATERYGAPIAQSLTQLSADNRADRRRRAEAVARRLPVTMLFPLVVCVLPAFLLVTVVPVLGEALRSFDFAASP